MVTFLIVALKLSIALLVLGVGLRSEPADLTFLVRHPGLLARTLFTMLVLMPLFAAALFITFALPPSVGIALVALALSPVPPVLPAKIERAGGHDSYTISLITTTALLAIVTVPLTLELLEAIFQLPLHTPVLPLVTTLATSILIPMAAGIGVAKLWPRTRGFGKAASAIGGVSLLAALLPIFPRLFAEMGELVGDGSLLAAIAFSATALLAGHVLGGPRRDQRSALALASATRHPMVAIAIGTANFPTDKLVAPAVFLVLLVSTILSFPYVRAMGRLPAGEKKRDRSGNPMRSHISSGPGRS